jgi:hypothetical protein
MTQDSKENSMPHVDEGTLHAYLDGELPSAERKTLEAHLADCVSCRTQLADERALLERASALLGATRPLERPAPPFEQLRPRTPKRSPWHVRTPVAWAASIALALGIGYYLAPMSRGRPSAPSANITVGQREIASIAQDEPASRVDQKKPRAKPAPADSRLRDSGTVVADQLAQTQTAAGGRSDSASVSERQVPRLEAPVAAAAPELRYATPTPVAAPSADTARALPRIAASAQFGRLPTTTKWPIISSGTARSLLGTDPVGVPGLAGEIRRSPANDGTVVVEQKIDSATTIQIFQQPNATAALYELDSSARFNKSARGAAQTDRLARYMGKLRVEIAGPLSSDSLNKLLDQVQPLP